MKTYKLQHRCSDMPHDRIYTWDARKENPKSCPRCKKRLDAPKPKTS